jgi:hypothetical protein
LRLLARATAADGIDHAHIVAGDVSRFVLGRDTACAGGVLSGHRDHREFRALAGKQHPDRKQCERRASLWPPPGLHRRREQPQGHPPLPLALIGIACVRRRHVRSRFGFQGPRVI